MTKQHATPANERGLAAGEDYGEEQELIRRAREDALAHLHVDFDAGYADVLMRAKRLRKHDAWPRIRAGFTAIRSSLAGKHRSLALATASLAVIIVGLALAAMVANGASIEDWSRRSDVGRSFDMANIMIAGLAFPALIVTLWIQFYELRLQRAELRMQREAIDRSSTELQHSAAAGMRALHVGLLRMSIDDEELASIWPDAQSVSPSQYRLYLYANLIFHHIALSMQVFGYTEQQMRPYIRHVFESPVIREYWVWSADARAKTYVPGTDAWKMARIGNQVYREFHPDAVLADDDLFAGRG